MGARFHRLARDAVRLDEEGLYAECETERHRGRTLVFAHNRHLQRQRSEWRLAGMDLAGLFVTTLQRTHQTAAPFADRSGLTPVEIPDLREVHLGEWERGEYRARIAAADPLAIRVFVEQEWSLIPGAETNEAFGEIQVPLLKDRPFFQNLSFSGAARITNVKAVRRDDGLTEKDKGNWTYKLGGNWAVNSVVRFRGTYGTSFRAPALFEEFKANETGFISARTIDPCVRWAANLAQSNISQRVADNCAADGIPDNPDAWLLTVARRLMLDRLKHQRYETPKLCELNTTSK